MPRRIGLTTPHKPGSVRWISSPKCWEITMYVDDRYEYYLRLDDPTLLVDREAGRMVAEQVAAIFFLRSPNG